MSALVASWAKVHSSASCDVLEIGSWTGGSAITWAKALDAASVEGKVVCVDKWDVRFEPSTNVDAIYREMTRAAESGEAERLFCHNVRAAGVDKRIVLLRGLSQDVLPFLERGRFAIVFVDGSHIYQDVLHDIQNAVGLVQNGGVVCGDDLELQRDECSENGLQSGIALHTDYQLDERTGQSYHPGVTAAVAEVFGRVSVWEGFWATRRSENAWRGVELDEVHDEPPAHLRSTTEVVPVLVAEGINGHNVIQVDDTYIGIPASIGPLHIDDETSLLTAMQASIVGTSLDAVKEEIAQRSSEPTVNHSPEKAIDAGAPVLIVDGYKGFNLVTYRGRYYALDQRLGPVQLEGSDFAVFAARGLAAVADSETTARQIVDELAARLAHSPDDRRPDAEFQPTTEALVAEMRNISSKVSEMAAAVGSMAASMTGFDVERRISHLNQQVVELTRALGEASDAHEQTRAELTAALQEHRRMAAAHAEMGTTLTSRETELAAARQRIADLSASVNSLNAAVSDASNKTREAELALSRAGADLAALRASALKQDDAHVRDLKAAQKRIRELKRRVQASDEARHVLEAEGKELYSWVQRLQREFITGARSS